MGQFLNGSSRRTEAVRQAIQRSEESVRALVGATRSVPRPHVSDQPMGPSSPRSSVLSAGDEAIIVTCPSPQPASPERLSKRPAALDPAPDPVVIAPVPGTRHGTPDLPDMEGDAFDFAGDRIRLLGKTKHPAWG